MVSPLRLVVVDDHSDQLGVFVGADGGFAGNGMPATRWARNSSLTVASIGACVGGSVSG